MPPIPQNKSIIFVFLKLGEDNMVAAAPDEQTPVISCGKVGYVCLS
jgi:hypothetical protein